MERQGRFTLSDDCHGVAQVGTNYDKLLTFVEDVGIDRIVFFERDVWSATSRPGQINAVPVDLENIRRQWQSQR